MITARMERNRGPKMYKKATYKFIIRPKNRTASVELEYLPLNIPFINGLYGVLESKLIDGFHRKKFAVMISAPTTPS